MHTQGLRRGVVCFSSLCLWFMVAVDEARSYSMPHGGATRVAAETHLRGSKSGSRLLKKEKGVNEDETGGQHDDDCWGWTVEEWGNGEGFEKCEEGGGFDYQLDPDEPPKRCRDEQGTRDISGWYDVCLEWDRLFGTTGGTIEEPLAPITTSPTDPPTASVTAGPTNSPTNGPIVNPTGPPTPSPTGGPTASLTLTPTSDPMSFPSSGPTVGPMSHPTQSLSSTLPPSSDSPFASPSVFPSASPSGSPLATPSARPSSAPSLAHDDRPADPGETPAATVPTAKPAELIESTSISLPTFSMDLVFFAQRRQLPFVGAMRRRLLLLNVDDFELEELVHSFLSKVFSELHPAFSELRLVLTIKGETGDDGVNGTTLRSIFTGNVIFSGSTFSEFPDQDELKAATLEAFIGTTFYDMVLMEADDPVLKAVQSVVVEEAITGTSSSSSPVPHQESDTGEGGSNAVLVVGIIVGVVSVAFLIALIAVYPTLKNGGNRSTLSPHESSLCVGSDSKVNHVKRSFFLKPGSNRASAGANEVLDTSSLHSSNPDKNSYHKFEDNRMGENEDESQFSGLKYGPSSVGEGMDTVEEEGEGMHAHTPVGGSLADDDTSTLMSMSDLTGGGRLGKVLQLECSEGSPHAKQMDFNDIWRNDESLKREDAARGEATPGGSHDAPRVKVEQHGSFTLELISDISFRPEDSQSDTTDLTDAKMMNGSMNLLPGATCSLSDHSDLLFE